MINNKRRMKCDFCSNMFGDAKMLRQHQTKTQYCLKIQAKIIVREKEAEAIEKAKLEVEAIEKAKIESEAIEKAKELLCQYCGKNFKNKYILHNHQIQVKYCLKIQESQNSQEIISSLVVCKYCNKNFSKGNFNIHDSTCKKKIQFFAEEIVKLKAEQEKEIYKLKVEQEKNEEIIKLKTEQEIYYKEQAIRAQNTIEEIAKQPTYQKQTNKITQNNIVADLTALDLNPSRVSTTIVDKYTTSDFYGGQRGAAQMIYKYLATDDNGKSQIICTDTSRGKFHYKDMNGKEVIDFRNVNLIKTINEPLKKKAGEISVLEMIKNPEMMETIGRNMSDIAKLDYKNGVFNTTMAELSGKYCARPIINQITPSIITPNQITLNVMDDLNNITDECLSENVKHLSIEHILKGPEGYTEYALEYSLKNSLKYDRETLLVKYKDKDGVVIMDPGMVNVSKKFFGSIQVKNSELIMAKLGMLNFAENMDIMIKLLDYKIAVENIADGVDGIAVVGVVDYVDGVAPDDIIDKKNFYDEFVKILLNKL
jgi:hypothetical protein